MGKIDEVEHLKTPQVDFRKTKKLEAKDLEAKEMIFKAGNIMRGPLTKLIGVAGVFFYEHGPNGFEYRTFISCEHVRDDLARAGAKQFNMALMESYGVKVPKDKIQ